MFNKTNRARMNILCGGVFAVLVFIACPAYVQAEGATSRPLQCIAVIPLKNLRPGDDTDWIGKVAAETFTTTFTRAPGVLAIEYARIKTIAKEQGLQNADLSDSKIAAKLGKLVGADFVLTGTYAKTDKKVFFSFRIIDVELAAVLSAFNMQEPEEKIVEELLDAAGELAKFFGKRFQDFGGELYQLLGDKLQKGNLDGAIKAYKKAIKLNPKHVKTYSSLVIALQKKGDLVDAIRTYKKVIELDPKNTEAYYNLGAALRRGNHGGAAKAVKKTIEPNPKLFRACRLLGLALQNNGDRAMEAGEYLQAAKAYAEAAHWCKDTDKKNQALLKQATAHLNVAWKTPDISDTVRREQYLGAKGLLKKILRQSPKFADAQRLLCDIAWAESSRRDAPAAAWQEYIRQAGKLIAITADEHRAYFRRGWANAQLAKDRKGEFIPAALKDMNHAIKIKNDIPDYWIGLANFTQWRGKHKEADKVYRKSLTTNPNNARLRVAYSLFLRRRDRSDEAIKQLREAIKRQPKSTIGHLALAGFYRAEKKFDDALKILESARKIDDSDFRIYGEMATIHAVRKQPKEVVRILKLGLDAIECRGKESSATKPAQVQNARLKEARVQLTVMLVDAMLDMVTARDKNSKELMAQVRQYAKNIDELVPKSAFRAKIFGRIALLDGKFSEATKLLEQAYEGFKVVDAGTVNILVKLYLRQGLPEKAEAIVDRILQARPTPSAMVLKAMLLMKSRQYESAKEVLVQTLKFDPQNAEAKTMLRSLLTIEKGSAPQTPETNDTVKAKTAL